MDRTQHILFVIPSLAHGGAERVLSAMANEWSVRGRQVTVVRLTDDSVQPFFSLDANVHLVSLGLERPSNSLLRALALNTKRIVRLRRAISHADPDVVISFIDRANILSVIATRGLHIPVIVSERSDPAQHHIGRVWSTARTLLYPYAEAVVVLTETAGSFFGERARSRVHIIPNAARPIEPEPAERSDSRKVVVGLGRLQHEKGFDLLVEAFSLVAEEFPDWKLEIWGDGPDREKLSELMRVLRLEQSASLHGAARRAATALSNADLFVLPSRYEGFPNALVEAMSLGLPVVSFDCPSGPRHIIRHGVDGILAPPSDVGALARAMRQLMRNGDERRRLAARALEVRDRFSVDHVMAMWEEVIREATQGRRCRR